MVKDWAVYDTTGKTIWKGYAGTTANVEGAEMVISAFERPRWTKQGGLTAQFVCATSKIRGVITLARSSSDNWRWRAAVSVREPSGLLHSLLSEVISR